jgi:uncharacterized protein (TIGR04168 family)
VTIRLGVVGDVHRGLTDADARRLDDQGYDMVLFVGDLGDRLHRGVADVCARIRRLRTPALVFPGNHDGPSPLGVLAETLRVSQRSGRGTVARTRQIERWLGHVPLVGFGLHQVGLLHIVSGRPWSMGGGMNFAAALHRRHGVVDEAQSVARLASLVDATSSDLIFIAHNGPRGLGGDRAAPWAERGHDRGDRDLAAAVARAGRRARAVVGGHVHHQLERRWHVEQGGVHYVNAARVPARGWHVALTITPTDVHVVGVAGR